MPDRKGFAVYHAEEYLFPVFHWKATQAFARLHPGPCSVRPDDWRSMEALACEARVHNGSDRKCREEVMVSQPRPDNFGRRSNFMQYRYIL
eukprot:scaffold207_cov267-Pinguiococcus_pyrenoidosus.AAC.10